MQGKGQHGTDLVRLFVAANINAEIRGKLAAEQERLERLAEGVKWVPPGQIHLTLVFLGDVFAGQVDAITAAMNSAAGMCYSFDVQIAGLGFFGSRHQPRVIWAGVGAGAEESVVLQAELAAGFRALNLVLDNRPFNPHLTLGRVKQPLKARGLADVLDRTPMSVYGTVRVDQVLLMSSELHPQGPVYKVVRQASLAAKG